MKTTKAELERKLKEHEEAISTLIDLYMRGKRNEVDEKIEGLAHACGKTRKIRATLDFTVEIDVPFDYDDDDVCDMLHDALIYDKHGEELLIVGVDIYDIEDNNE